MFKDHIWLQETYLTYGEKPTQTTAPWLRMAEPRSYKSFIQHLSMTLVFIKYSGDNCYLSHKPKVKMLAWKDLRMYRLTNNKFDSVNMKFTLICPLVALRLWNHLIPHCFQFFTKLNDVYTPIMNRRNDFYKKNLFECSYGLQTFVLKQTFEPIL